MRRSTIVSEIDLARAGAQALRGEARQTLMDRLRALDRQLLDARMHSATRRRSTALDRRGRRGPRAVSRTHGA